MERRPYRTMALLAVLAALLSACAGPRELVDERYRGEIDQREQFFRVPTIFPTHAVAADHPQASQAGAEVLAEGGNAVDAAVAASFALSVVRPDSCGIGGGGFMVVHLKGGPRREGVGDPGTPITVVIDYRERAPASASARMFEGLDAEASRWSGAAVAVPGTVAGLLHAHEKFGVLPRARVLAPAIRLARQGYFVDAHARRSAGVLARFMDERPDRPRTEYRAVRAMFIEPAQGGAAWKSETPPRAYNLAQVRVLERIASLGAAGFYEGPVARAIVNAAARHAPPGAATLTLADLAGARVREAAPLTFTWRGKTVHTMPPPSSGGVTLAQTLMLMDRCEGQWRGAFEGVGERLASQSDWSEGDPMPAPVIGSAFFHALAECQQHAFADRALYLGDPAFMPADVVSRLLDPARLDAKAALIDPDRTLAERAYADAAPLPDLLARAGGPPEDHGTSHLSVVDRWGNAVACTETINLEYGSRILVTEYGFFLNNQMDDFQTTPGAPNAFGLVQSERNAPGPGKCPLSSMTPTIVLDARGDVETIIGASGGPRIISAVTQGLLLAEFTEFGATASAVPRLHHQWKPGAVMIEPMHVVGAMALSAYRDAGGIAAENAERNLAELRALGDAALDVDPLWAEIARELRARGHDVKAGFDGAAVQMIRKDAEAGWHAVSDPRKGGAPAGQ